MSTRRCSVILAVLAVALGGCSSSSTPATSLPRSSSGEPGTTTPTKHHHHKGHHHQAARHHHHHPVRLAGVPAVDMPNRTLTPGVTLAVGTSRICTPGYASSVRNVPTSESDAVYARYHVVHVPYAHEVDHLISLELGGSNTIQNLWPEPYAGRWGARTKDELENRLHDLVCAGQVSLRAARHQEATNWVMAYKRYVSSTPPPASSGSSASSGSTSSGGYYASSYPTAHTIYCADDPEWRSLSKTYLVHFATYAAAHKRFPSYHLHQPC